MGLARVLSRTADDEERARGRADTGAARKLLLHRHPKRFGGLGLFCFGRLAFSAVFVYNADQMEIGRFLPPSGCRFLARALWNGGVLIFVFVGMNNLDDGA